MSFVDSPGFNRLENGIPKEPDSSEQKSRKRLIRLSILFVAALALGVANLFLSGQGGLILGRGSLTGTVVDELQQPLQAEIMVLGQPGAVWTDEQGIFVFESIPAGRQTLLVGYLQAAQMKAVQVEVGETTDLGLIQVRTAQRAGMEGVDRLDWR